MSNKRRKAKARKTMGFVPTLVVQANGRKRGQEGHGIGSHQEASPMGHATATPTKAERKRKRARKERQKGYTSEDV